MYLLIPTDFSPASEAAARYGGALARQLNAEVVLLHTYQVPVTMNDMPVVMISTQELQAAADAGLQRQRDALLEAYPGLSVRTEVRLGDLIFELKEWCRQHPPYLILTGESEARGVERVLFGNTSLSIVRGSDFPVLVVPRASEARLPRKAALALDLSEVERFPYRSVARIVEDLRLELHLIHVSTRDTRNVRAEDLQEGLAQLNPHCHIIEGGDFSEGVQNYLEAHAIDLLMAVPHEHSLLERLFFRTHTVELVEDTPLPVLCINELA